MANLNQTNPPNHSVARAEASATTALPRPGTFEQARLPGDNPTTAVLSSPLFLIVFLVAAYLIYRRWSSDHSSAAPGDTVEQAKRMLKAAANRGSFPPADTGGVLIKRGEFPILSSESYLSELKTLPRRTGLAASYRIGHITLYSGRLNAGNATRMTASGRGHLVLTNKRLIFTSAQRSLEINLANMTSIDNDDTHLLVTGAGTHGKPVMLLVENGPLWVALIRWTAATEPTENKLQADSFGVI